MKLYLVVGGDEGPVKRGRSASRRGNETKRGDGTTTGHPERLALRRGVGVGERARSCKHEKLGGAAQRSAGEDKGG